MCLGAGETEPKLARRREAAPGCRFLPGATGGNNADDDCFASLLPFVPEARRSLRRDFRLNAYDADDVAMEALLATCTAKTEVRDRRLYFFRVARNQAKKEVMIWVFKDILDLEDDNKLTKVFDHIGIVSLDRLGGEKFSF